MKTRELHIKDGGVEIETRGEVTKVSITDVGVYEQVGSFSNSLTTTVRRISLLRL